MFTSLSHITEMYYHASHDSGSVESHGGQGPGYAPESPPHEAGEGATQPMQGNTSGDAQATQETGHSEMYLRPGGGLNKDKAGESQRTQEKGEDLAGATPEHPDEKHRRWPKTITPEKWDIRKYIILRTMLWSRSGHGKRERMWREQRLSIQTENFGGGLRQPRGKRHPRHKGRTT